MTDSYYDDPSSEPDWSYDDPSDEPDSYDRDPLRTIEKHDPLTAEYIREVALVAEALARELGLIDRPSLYGDLVRSATEIVLFSQDKSGVRARVNNRSTHHR